MLKDGYERTDGAKDEVQMPFTTNQITFIQNKENQTAANQQDTQVTIELKNRCGKESLPGRQQEFLYWQLLLSRTTA